VRHVFLLPALYLTGLDLCAASSCYRSVQVLNAGISPPIPLLQDTTPESWVRTFTHMTAATRHTCRRLDSFRFGCAAGGAQDKIFDVNVKSNMILATMCIPHFTEGSAIVFISSAGAYTPGAPHAA
jgi:NAD(P)-dependent dehydrogenase (short-subunit alcohol dehydrogenase family)